MVKDLPANADDAREAGLIPGLRRFPRGENGNLLQYSCLGDFMEREARWTRGHGVAKSRTRLRDFISLSLSLSKSWRRLGMAYKHEQLPKLITSLSISAYSFINNIAV